MKTSYIVICSTSINVDGALLVVYVDETEKHFEHINDAEVYKAYLEETYPNWLCNLYVKDVVGQGVMNLENLRRERALAKLTNQEKEILGL
jgi:deoxyadenosine/deoxycytidine kinase